MKKYEAIRQAIKQLADQQRKLKPQRKTKHFKGNRTVEPWKALYQHGINRDTLMHLHMAYRVLKGKEIIPPKYKEYSQNTIDNLVKEFEIVEEVIN